ncbi:MAG TPA: single-stranded-DNA-specific exonuclease RecJ [Phycisphaerae bacterium]|nr:single-stranded-DNA-specific exonuclease RecJ [Phycisphaerae bacterium]HOJ74664.1 single-stranded-DNA-specific exonuclease RecJ [Phycisphaerae bacterium]HOM50563.1 single-stranded-DNA-specific exonuclease RecJ [Phycisphaerae bacterium]HON66380.1 single-stranded-DNA-specific exonuclease RecJ [Phycisphaerae bacterium]HOQ84785.1 single-stranded-DNA-specific exonuclease RecJ [Phycisphaerae bacterium]
MQWIIKQPWPGCESMARRLGVHPLIVQLLFNRGLDRPEAMKAFLEPRMSMLHAPEELPGAKEAAALIVARMHEGKRIVIYGDYDVDGITGTAILWHLLTLAGADVSFYIPHRIDEGYGLNADAVRQLARDGYDVLITVDCGITAVEEIRLARDLGLTTVITDHHRPGSTLPDAHVVVHPGLEGKYPNHDLCGAGVAFKLAWAIAKHLSNAEKVSPEFREFLTSAMGLVALGTIADVVPLLGENRVLARYGLANLKASKLSGIAALIESARLADQKLNSDHVGFWLAPRLNAAGRMGHAQLAAELLTRADEKRAREIAQYLEEQNRSRQNLERRIFNEAVEIVQERKLATDARRAIVVAGEGWHAGVIGIVASRLVERFGRPTLMISLDNGEGQGSGRSIPNFDLHKALAECAHHLLTYGGHAMAAGLRVKRSKLEEFTEHFVERANRTLTARDLEPTLHLDAEAGPSVWSVQLAREVEKLGPFGAGNHKPKFASPVLHLDGEPRAVGRSANHLQFCLTDGRCRMKAIAFDQADKLEALRVRRQCRVAYEPCLNEFNGRVSVEMQVIDISFA